MKKVVICIPAFDEDESIDLTINRIQELYPPSITHPKGYNIELLVVNDGSSDKTGEVVVSRGIKLVSHIKNLIELLRVYGTFMAIQIPYGSHKIKFEYIPPSSTISW